MRSRLAERAKTTEQSTAGPDAACRSQTAAAESGAPPAARRPRRASAAQLPQQRPRERPPWNGDDGSDDDDDGGRGASSREHHAPEPARARQPEWQSDISHAPPAPDDDDDALPSGWTAHLDQKRGREYYHHKDRGETTWHRPARQPPQTQRDVDQRPAAPSDDDDDDSTRHAAPSRARSDHGGKVGAPAATAEGRHRTLWRPVAPEGPR
jgi:hypothetical protein